MVEDLRHRSRGGDLLRDLSLAARLAGDSTGSNCLSISKSFKLFLRSPSVAEVCNEMVTNVLSKALYAGSTILWRARTVDFMLLNMFDKTILFVPDDTSMFNV